MKPLYLLLLIFGISQAVIEVDRRMDCHPEPGLTVELCTARDCIYDEQTVGPTGTPKCYMAADKIGYTAASVSDGSSILTKNNGPKSPWDVDINSIRFRFADLGNGVANVRIDTVEARFDPAPILDLPRETLTSNEKLHLRTTTGDPFSFAIERADGGTLFDTSIGGLIFTDQFIQIAALIPSDKMYGWGEHIHQSLKVTTLPAPGLVYRTTGGVLDMYFFPGPTPNDVIAQYHAFIGRAFMPSYWALGFQLSRWGYKSLDDLKNRVAVVMAYNIPLDVVYADIDYMEKRKDFTTGDRWTGLGVYVDQLHNWGMSTILIFDPAVQVDYEVFQRAKDRGVSFIEWERADQVQQEIQSEYPMANDTKFMLGLVWPEHHVAFPDFLDTTSATDEWWEDEFKWYHQEVKFDGAWIDMNEPQVFYTRNTPHERDPREGRYPLVCPKTGPDAKWDSPPYPTHSVFYWSEIEKDSFLAQESLCLSGMTQRRTNRVYNTHNLYGWSESRTTSAVMKKTTGRRSNVIARSTFASSGRFTGHWLGDNSATWNDLRTSISEVMEFNMFGLPYVGSDVCGFIGRTTEELCLRWQQMGAFHSFYRNHNALEFPAQDPAVWPSVAAATKKANDFRYRYLPYLYHLHYRASTSGETVIRPLFFEFPSDEQTHEISYQFMWGRSIMVAPVYTQGVSTVDVYIPKNDVFYSIYDQDYGQKVATGLSTYDARTTYNAPTFVRGSSIVARHQSSALTTTSLRKLPYSLLIVPGSDSTASGSQFWDDGDSIVEDWSAAEYCLTEFTYSTVNGPSLSMNVQHRTPNLDVPDIIELEIFDYPSAPDYTSFTLNGSKLSVNTQASKYSPITRILTVTFSRGISLPSEVLLFVLLLNSVQGAIHECVVNLFINLITGLPRNITGNRTEYACKWAMDGSLRVPLCIKNPQIPWCPEGWMEMVEYGRCITDTKYAEPFGKPCMDIPFTNTKMLCCNRELLAADPKEYCYNTTKLCEDDEIALAQGRAVPSLLSLNMTRVLLFVLLVTTVLLQGKRDNSPTEFKCAWVGKAPFCASPDCPADRSPAAYASKARSHHQHADEFGDYCWTGSKTLCCKNEEVYADPFRHCHRHENSLCPRNKTTLFLERENSVVWEDTKFNTFCCERIVFGMKEVSASGCRVPQFAPFNNAMRPCVDGFVVKLGKTLCCKNEVMLEDNDKQYCFYNTLCPDTAVTMALASAGFSFWEPLQLVPRAQLCETMHKDKHHRKFRHCYPNRDPASIRKDVLPFDCCSIFPFSREYWSHGRSMWVKNLESHDRTALCREDPFGINQYHLGFSLNKKKRWQIEQEILVLTCAFLPSFVISIVLNGDWIDSVDYHTVSRDGIVTHRHSNSRKTRVRSFTHPDPQPTRKAKGESRRAHYREDRDSDGFELEYNHNQKCQLLHVGYTITLYSDRASLHNKASLKSPFGFPRKLSKKYQNCIGVEDEREWDSEDVEDDEEVNVDHDRFPPVDLSSLIVDGGKRKRKISKSPAIPEARIIPNEEVSDDDFVVVN
ncbi:hypothetical protein PRIPAC_73785 [Pristionchus pacificus]|uniref:Glycoside hydrolase n=1 Tax=Pristionchus pacificus TaxID=54126 RepID=A0A2A6B5F1_PRIPA|nr:hypothetical protein PRIPAC_73785 [Pristionchus pacificus]|eukprot:PDM61115.1 glycoside hydrolase [Pristionchus pacificus]